MPKQEQTPKTIYLSDYQPPDYRVESIDLHFDLYDTETVVKSKLSITKRVNGPQTLPLILNGDASVSYTHLTLPTICSV